MSSTCGPNVGCSGLLPNHHRVPLGCVDPNEASCPGRCVGDSRGTSYIRSEHFYGGIARDIHTAPIRLTRECSSFGHHEGHLVRKRNPSVGPRHSSTSALHHRLVLSVYGSNRHAGKGRSCGEVASKRSPKAASGKCSKNGLGLSNSGSWHSGSSAVSDVVSDLAVSQGPVEDDLGAEGNNNGAAN